MNITEISLAPQPFIGIRDKVVDPGPLFSEGLPRLFGYAAEHGIAPAGPPIGIYYDVEEGMFDMAVGLPTIGLVEGEGDIFSDVLPDGKAVTAEYVGPYEGLGRAWQEFMTALAEDGYSLRAASWEDYRTGGDDSDPKDWLTVLVVPVV